MKHLYLVLSLFLVAITQGQTTQDTLYVWKAGNLVIKQSIKTTDMDSITFKRPIKIISSLPSIIIGTQTWTTKNLDVDTYSDGTPIPQVTDQTAWGNLTTGAWCYYENNTANGTTYGKLYNWYAVAGIWNEASKTNVAQRKKLAPTGYHVPTDAEWTTLTSYLGGDAFTGGKMKETGTMHWNSPNTAATNSSGFSGLPGGARNSTGLFYSIGINGDWWSSSEQTNTDVAWNRSLRTNFGYAYIDFESKSEGLSVRCLRDEGVAPAPTVGSLTTTAVSTITATTATTGATITSDGGAAITERGVVWSTSSAPTIALSTKTTDGLGTGSFTSTLTGLTPATTYYVRAYVTNSAGTNYGAEVNFTTLASIAVVTIGTQTWTTKNLDVATYSDGTVIPQVTDPTAWVNLTTGAWCYYNNDSANGAIYGKLYNWYAVAGIHDTDPSTPNKKLAPTGYHIASDNELTTLVTYLGGESVAGGKMKAKGTSLWLSPNTRATNSSGFTGLPGGLRQQFDGGSFDFIGAICSLWSSTEYDTAHAAGSRLLEFHNDDATTGILFKTHGFSVRCLRD